MTLTLKKNEFKFPSEMVGKIMSFLPPNDIKEWLLLAYFKQDSELVYEIKRTYIYTIKYYSQLKYNLYKIYFNLNNIDTHGKYLLTVLEIYNSTCNDAMKNRIDAISVRINLADKLVEKDRTKFLNLTKYISRYPG
jgi:hypothetical protein